MTESTPNTITRSQAAGMLDELLEIVASHNAQRYSDATFIEAVKETLHGDHRWRLEPLVKCHGEAHANGWIDNCAVCLPRWAFIGPRVRVR